MALTFQEVVSTDALRKRLVHLKDLGAAVAGASQDFAVVRGLNDSGGTIQGVYARAGTAFVGTITVLAYDVNKNGTTVFTGTKLVFTTAVAKAEQTSFTAAGAKVYNGDLLSLDCDAIGDSTAGSNIGVAVEIRVDEPND